MDFFLESSYFSCTDFIMFLLFLFINFPSCHFRTTEATFHLSVTQRRHDREKKVPLFLGETLLPLKLMSFRSIKEMCLLQKNNLKFGLGKYELCSRRCAALLFTPFPTPPCLPPKVAPLRIRLWMKGFD